MTKEQAEFLVNAMKADGLDAELRDKYSGRGMRGRETCAIVADGLSGVLRAALRAAGDDPDAIPDFNDFDPSVDSMGRGVVVY